MLRVGPEVGEARAGDAIAQVSSRHAQGVHGARSASGGGKEGHGFEVRSRGGERDKRALEFGGLYGGKL